MQKTVFFSMFCMSIWLVKAQGDLYIGSGATLYTNGTSTVTLHNTKLTNNGSLTANDGTVYFKGNSTNAQSSINGTGTTAFRNVTIDKTVNGIQLNQNISLSNYLTLTSGGLDLAAGNVNLGTTGSLQSETEINRVSGTGGYLEATSVLNAPNAVNTANLGATITSAANLGPTLIRRKHQPVTVPGTSIYRVYEIVPTNNTNLNATFRFAYLEAELNGNNENDMRLFEQPIPAGAWTMRYHQTRNMGANWFEINGLNSFATWTAAENLIMTAPSISASNLNPCVGTQVTLTASPAVGLSPVEYLWYKNGVTVNYQNGGNGTYIVNVGTSVQANQYTVKIVYANSTSLSNSATPIIVTTQAPNATITPAGPTTFCANTPTTLNATAGMNTYIWKRGSITVGTNSASYIPVASGNHTVTVTDVNGCSKTSALISITSNALPVANAGADKNVCVGSSVQIGSTNNTANTYTWSPTTGITSPATAMTSANPNGTTTYTVTVTNNTTGCSNSDQVAVSVLPLPATPSLAKSVSGTTATLTPNASGASTINWYRDGSILLSNRPPATAINVAVSNPAKSYTIRSKGANGCLSQSSIAVTAKNGNDKDGDLIIEWDNDIIKAYPNPTQGDLQVSLKGVNATNGTLYLYNAIGQIVLSQAVELVHGEANISFDVSNVAAGIYSLSFENEVVKVVKE